MRMLVLPVLAMLMFTVSLRAAQPGQPAPPEHVLRRNRTAVPAWIALSKALNPDGTIKWSLLPSDAEDVFKRHLDNPHDVVRVFRVPPGTITMPRPESCDVTYVGLGFPYFGHPAGDLPDLVEYSLAIYRGRVTGQSLGFSGDTPATLVGLAVSDPIKRSDEVAQGRVWMVYPSARFTAEGRAVCTWDYTFPPVPEPGDEVLLFIFNRPLDAEGRIVELTDSRLLIIGRKRDGKLILPSFFLRSGELDGVTTLDGVVQRVRELLHRSGRRRREDARGGVRVISH